MTMIMMDTMTRYATLLRRLPDLTSLGRCDCLPLALAQLEAAARPRLSRDTRGRDTRDTRDTCRPLALTSVHCEAAVSEAELGLVVRLCPALTSLQLVYR